LIVAVSSDPRRREDGVALERGKKRRWCGLREEARREGGLREEAEQESEPAYSKLSENVVVVLVILVIQNGTSRVCMYVSLYECMYGYACMYLCMYVCMYWQNI